MLVQGVNCSILKIIRNLLSTLTFTFLSFVIFQFAEAETEAEAEAAEGSLVPVPFLGTQIVFSFSLIL